MSEFPGYWRDMQEDEALSFNAYGKGSGCARKVHALIRGDPDTRLRRGREHSSQTLEVMLRTR
ncbi:MAG: hypothetical protein WD708_01935 [Kiritimatiellia bacterium]